MQTNRRGWVGFKISRANNISWHFRTARGGWTNLAPRDLMWGSTLAITTACAAEFQSTMRVMTLWAFRSIARYVEHVPSTHPPYDTLVTGVFHKILHRLDFVTWGPRPSASNASDGGMRTLSHLSCCFFVRSSECGWYWRGYTVTCRCKTKLEKLGWW